MDYQWPSPPAHISHVKACCQLRFVVICCVGHILLTEVWFYCKIETKSVRTSRGRGRRLSELARLYWCLRASTSFACIPAPSTASHDTCQHGLRTFPGKSLSRKDVSRIVIFPERRFPENHFPGKTVCHCFSVKQTLTVFCVNWRIILLVSCR